MSRGLNVSLETRDVQSGLGQCPEMDRIIRYWMTISFSTLIQAQRVRCRDRLPPSSALWNIKHIVWHALPCREIMTERELKNTCRLCVSACNSLGSIEGYAALHGSRQMMDAVRLAPTPPPNHTTSTRHIAPARLTVTAFHTGWLSPQDTIQ